VALLLTAATPQVSSRLEPSKDDSVELLGEAAPPSEKLCLWYRRPARQWVEALALGNGRLGAMVLEALLPKDFN
jgi:alpha-L-fucosidase 2